MKTIKKTVSIVCSFIILLALGGFVFVRNFDLNRYKSYIEDIVFRETGRELKLNGEAKIGISLIPTIEINDVTFSNPEWASTPYMARFESLEVKFAIVPLLRQQIDIDRIILKSPQIYLEESAKGQKNWVFDTPMQTPQTINQTAQVYGGQVQGNVSQSKNASMALVTGLIAEKIEIDDGIVDYVDGKTKQTTRVEIKDFDWNIPSSNAPMALTVEAFYNGQKILLESEIESLDSILREQNATFEAEVRAFNVQAVLNGGVQELTGNIKYAVEANIHNPAGNFDAPETSAELRIDGDMNTASVDVRRLALATNILTGRMSADWSKAKPVVKANLSGGVFDLRALSKNSMLSQTNGLFIKNAQALEVVPNDKVPYQYLNMVNASINTRCNQLIVDDDTTLTDVSLVASLQAGILNVSDLKASIGNGTIVSKIIVNAAKQWINATVEGKDIKVQDLEKDFATGKNGGIQVLSGGNMDFNLKIITNGATWRALSENLDGQFAAVLGKSQIKTGKLDWLTNNIFTQLFEVMKIDSNKVKNMDITCSVVRTDFKNGIAKFPNGVVFDSSELKLVSSGTLNLRNDKLDFTVAPTMNKLASGNITQALAGFIRMGGTISNPKVKLDTSTALTTVVGAVMTGGASLGADVLLSGSDSPCYTALQGTKYASRFPKPMGVKAETKDAYNGTVQQTKETVKELGNAAKSLLKGFKRQLKGN